MDSKYIIRQLAARINEMQKFNPNLICQIHGDIIANLIYNLFAKEKEEFYRCFIQYNLDLNTQFDHKSSKGIVSIFPANSPLVYECNNDLLKVVFPEQALFSKLEPRLQQYIKTLCSDK